MRKRSHKRHPVFLDTRQRHARRLRFVVALSGFALLAWLTTFALGVYSIDILPESERLDLIRRGSVADDGHRIAGTAVAQPDCAGQPIAATDLLPGAARSRTSAYLRAWPDGALEALAHHCSGLDGVLAEWLSVDAGTQTVEWLNEAGSGEALERLGRAQPGLAVEVVARLHLPPSDAGDAVLKHPEARARIIAGLTSKVADGTYTGLCLYPDRFDLGDLEGLRALVRDLRAALPEGVRTCIVTEAEGALWRDAGLVEAVDSVLLRAFREPGPGARPGPLAPQDWFEALLDDAFAAVGPEKLRLALGSFGYLWTEGDSAPVAVSFAEALRLAARHGGTVALDTAALNTHVTFTDAGGRKAEIWLLDVASLHNEILALAGRYLSGVVLWAAGFEDPGAWLLVQRGGVAPPAAALETVAFPDYVGYEGEGPFRRVTEAAVTGHRRLFRDPATGRITGMIYDPMPRPATVERFGHRDEKIVALTFDDGPDAGYTAEILDRLRQSGVPGTFFLIGSNMVSNPGVVRRMVDEGHEVGSHTFFHPEEIATGAGRSRLELNAVQRLLASVTGRTTYLFRTPYGRSEGPLTAAEAAQQAAFEREGYVVAGADIVPRDWEGMTASQIADYVMGELRGDGGQVVILHDAGGDRSATVAAVPILIDRLRAAGYRLVPLSDFLGLTRDEVMPPAADRLTPLDRASFAAVAGLGRALVWVFWAAVGYGVARSLFVLSLALLRRHHPAGTPAAPGSATAERVTVLIPAFNEELVIADAIAAALASDHPGISVIVVDDGSTDGTAAVVTRTFGDDPRVRLVRQANRGKWSALNTAYGEVETGVVVAVDADTILHPGAVTALLGHFADPRVGAVAGNVKVANRHGLLPRLQALEYITAQNIDRRAAESLNAIMVVPGSIGAWRTEAVRKVGFYSPDTITEDADLTLSILRAGYRVVFEERALSFTDAPDTLSGFMRQRLRWTFGMMQTAWKHRRAAKTARGAGLFSIPDLWLTGIIMGLMAPLADAVLAGVLARGALGLLQGQPPGGGDATAAMIAGWAILPALDLVVALTAFGFERGESLRLLLLVPFQRLFYRQLLWITVYRAVGHALAGRIAGWGKLVRLGSIGRTAP
jgi:peptidoglycan/xylan/chitin deacetylase (PgdA/CDA1 family)